MKKIVFVLIIILVVKVLVADTNINGGAVSGTWTYNNSPYNVMDDIYISNGQALSIEPGVVINFFYGAKLDVYGRLSAQGIFNNKILFHNAENTYWNGIKFHNLTDEDELSELICCNIENANVTIDSCLNILISDCEISGAYNSGIRILNSSDIRIEKSYIISNSYPYGAGLYIIDSNVKLTNDIISNNSSIGLGDNAFGGGIYSLRSNVQLISCQISKNSVEHFVYMHSDGVSLGGGIYAKQSDFTIINSTIADNTSMQNYRNVSDCNIMLYENSTMDIYNSIIWYENNSAGITVTQNSNMNIFYSTLGSSDIVIDNNSHIFVDENTFRVKPMFVNADENDYRLTDSSVGINYGTIDFPFDIELPQFDLAGNPRIYLGSNQKIDLGAYEYQGEPVGEQNIYVSKTGIHWEYAYVNPPYQDKSFIIFNLGYMPLTVLLNSYSDNFLIKRENDSLYTTVIELFEIPSNSHSKINVIFDPTHSGDFESEIHVTSNDVDEPEKIIAVSGHAVNAMHVGGVINENTLWNADTLIVEDDITIEEGATLTINPGANILFAGHYKIDVRGNILAIGDSLNHIGFQYINDNYSNYKWNGIQFLNTLANSDSSIFVYCDFKQARNPDTSDFSTINIDNFSKIRFEHCNFTSNKFPNGNGGVIRMHNVNSIRFKKCNFSENNGHNGGAIYANDADNLTFIGCSIHLNTSESESGGGVYFKNSSVLFKNSMINNNFAYEGAGLYIQNSSIEIDNCNISGNGKTFNLFYSYVTASGAGIYSDNSNIKIKNTKITKNNYTYYFFEESGFDCTGSGIYAKNYSNLDIINSDIVYNKIGDVLENYYSNLYINNTTVNLVNCIIWNDNRADVSCYSNSTINVYFSDIGGGEQGIHLHNSQLNWGANNLNANPLFINVSWNNLDVHLQENSPVINAGTPDTTGLFLPDYDIGGNPRVYDGTIDMGCYEWQGVSSEPSSITTNSIMLTNYPNPFNPTTTIAYSLPKNCKKAEIKIYNLKGQKVRTFKLPTCAKGKTETIVWNGKNDKGKNVGSGMYLYKLEIDGKTKAVKKCLMIK